MKSDILIYEFEGSYFVIQRSQQGKNSIRQTVHQMPSENVDLFSKLPFSCSIEELGKAAIEALDNYDKVSPKHEPWELSALNRQLCTWLGTRYFATITKNCRLVQLIRNENMILIIPFDNYNKNSWNGPMTKEAGFREDKFFTISSESSYETIGEFIIEAFSVSTYHPERKKKGNEKMPNA